MFFFRCEAGGTPDPNFYFQRFHVLRLQSANGSGACTKVVDLWFAEAQSGAERPLLPDVRLCFFIAKINLSRLLHRFGFQSNKLFVQTRACQSSSSSSERPFTRGSYLCFSCGRPCCAGCGWPRGSCWPPSCVCPGMCPASVPGLWDRPPRGWDARAGCCGGSVGRLMDGRRAFVRRRESRLRAPHPFLCCMAALLAAARSLSSAGS